tara:strand:- start:673 stop:1992 length:1320 start_codon:yes stop_codon:yes gene_type:complete
MLIGASFIFYSWNNPILGLLLLASVLVNSYGSFILSKPNQKNKRLINGISISLNLGLLICFKYLGLLSNIFFGFKVPEDYNWLLTIPLPIGISFYTFQGISLLIDTKKKIFLFEENISFLSCLVKVSTYITFFPQLIAGPIIKPAYFINQMKYKYFKKIRLKMAIRYLILGYFLKSVIGDNSAVLSNTYMVDPIYTYLNSISNLIFLFSYSIRIFADFAGYSFIAIGLAILFGYRLKDNFNRPYNSESVTEFWRRWHITLYAWFNEYLYMPFVIYFRHWGTLAILLGLFITFTLAGIWHGDSINCLLYGAYFGLILCAEFYLKKWKKKLKIKTNKLINVLCVFGIWNFGLTLFYFENYKDFSGFIISIFNNWNVYYFNNYMEVYALMLAVPVILYHSYEFLPFRIKKRVVLNTGIIYGVMLYLIIFDYGPQESFIYFKF